MLNHTLNRDLETIFPFAPIEQLSDALLVEMLKAALVAERKRGMSGDWSYCHTRHSSIIFCLRSLNSKSGLLLL
jgi:hypothetical protein